MPIQDLFPFEDSKTENVIVDFINYAISSDKAYLEENKEYVYKLFMIIKDIILEDYSSTKNSNKHILKSSLNNAVLNSYASLINNVEIH